MYFIATAHINERQGAQHTLGILRSQSITP